VADSNWFVAERQGVRESLAAVDAGQSAKAIPALKAVVERYLALPVRWSMDASVALVRAYTEQKQFAEADAVAKQFMDAHPTLVNLVRPYLALALAGQGKYDEAIGLLTEVVKASGDKLVVTPTEGRMLGTAYLALGDCHQAKGDAEKALESYLTTVVLYYHDDAVVRQAQTKADELKKKIRPQAAKADK
jgi:tetratricopeptide (TPR) repeat protein